MTAAVQGREVVTKAEFARLIGRSKPCVTGYVKDGKLSGAALVVQDGHEMIDKAEALRQLDINLDQMQRAAQGAPAATPQSEDQQRLLKAKADTAEIEATQKRAALLAGNGTLVFAGEVQAAWSRRLAELVGMIEQDFGTIADRVLEAGGDRRAVVIALRQGFREVRRKIAARMGEAAAATEPLLEEPLP